MFHWKRSSRSGSQPEALGSVGSARSHLTSMSSAAPLESSAMTDTDKSFMGAAQLDASIAFDTASPTFSTSIKSREASIASDAETRDSSVMSDIDVKVTSVPAEDEKPMHQEPDSEPADVLVAFDGSGSTGGCEFYHDQVQRIVAELPTAKLLFWDHSHRPISRGELAEINHARRGGGGTQPAQVARFILENEFHGHLVVITDGQVGSYSVDACAALLAADWKFDHVTAHLIGEQRSVNLSVTCPFTRNSPHIVYTYYRHQQYERRVCTDVTQQDFDALEAIDQISTMGSYMQHADAIERAATARTMGTMGDLGLCGAMHRLKERVDRSEVARAGSSASLYSPSPDMGAVAGSSFHPRFNRFVGMTSGAIRETYEMGDLESAISAHRSANSEAE